LRHRINLAIIARARPSEAQKAATNRTRSLRGVQLPRRFDHPPRGTRTLLRHLHASNPLTPHAGLLEPDRFSHAESPHRRSRHHVQRGGHIYNQKLISSSPPIHLRTS